MPFTIPTTIRVHHATLAKATKLEQMLAAEYPALTLDVECNDVAVMAWNVYHFQQEEAIYSEAKVPDLADLIETCEDLGLDPEEKPEGTEEDEEPKKSGSVVPETYRALYREASSNGQTCGDWLAEWLVLETHGPNGLIVDDLTAIFQANGLDLSKGWGLLPTSGQKGWVGRYRMNGRQVLEKQVAKTGLVRQANGDAVIPPQDFLDTLRAKHSKWLAKEAKRLEAALASAGKQEGEAGE